jgi:hypothetical protein
MVHGLSPETARVVRQNSAVNVSARTILAVKVALLVTAVVASAGIIAAAAQRIPDEAWAKADLSVRRLSPDTFRVLPASIRKELIRLGCTIPQTYEQERPHNVISGRFTASTGTDWVVLCSRARISSILVFRRGQTPPLELATAPDREYLQGHLEGLGGSAIGFSRVISVASARFIRAAAAAGHGGPAPPPLDHDGIDDAFTGKGSTVLYFHSGKWLTLAGSD